MPGYVEPAPKPELLKIKGALDMALLKARQREADAGGFRGTEANRVPDEPGARSGGKRGDRTAD